jgi:hypothetical protein
MCTGFGSVLGGNADDSVEEGGAMLGGAMRGSAGMVNGVFCASSIV